MNELEFAYLAGYIDGDGCFCVGTAIQKPKGILVFEYSIQISSTDKQILNHFTNIFGGFINFRRDKRIDRRECHVWTGKTKSAHLVCHKTERILVHKTTQRNRMYLLGNMIKPSRGFVIDQVTLNIRHELIRQIKQEIHMTNLITEKDFRKMKKVKKTFDPSEENLAYLAGLIDAEGCLRITSHDVNRTGRSRSYVATLEIGNTRLPIFQWLLERFGGTITYRAPTNRNHNPMIIWSLRSRKLYNLLFKIQKYLRVKKERCEKLLELEKTTLKIGGNRKTGQYRCHVEQILSKRESIFQELKLLNAKGKH